MTEYIYSDNVDNGRGGMKMLGYCEILLLAISIFAALYFGFKSMYHWGYAQGYMDHKPDRASCMEYIIRYGK